MHRKKVPFFLKILTIANKSSIINMVIILERQILHVDVNNAFLSWTAVQMLKEGNKLDIRTIPSIIGGDEQKRSGIVLAKSPLAKEFGIKTGETLYSARKKCPSIKIYPTNFKIYKEYSNNLYKQLLKYTDKIERFSIDECFMDMTGFLINKTLLDKANEISKEIKKKFGFAVNIGVANNKLLAKMASNFEKPDKVHTLFYNEIKSKMWNLPVSDLFMLGKKTVPKLSNMGIKTIGDLANSDENRIIKIFGKHGKTIWQYANGIDESEVNNKYEVPKGIGNSVTLPTDISSTENLEKVLLDLTEQVTFRLRKYNLLANTVNVQLRTKDFKDFSHQKKFLIATDSTKQIYITAKQLLLEMHKNGEFIRLIGMRVDNLTSKTQIQLSIFTKDEKQEKLDNALDSIKNKYGYQSIKRAKQINLN